MGIHAIVGSDWFTLLVGIAGIISAIAAVTAVSKINTVIRRTDSNKINNQSQSVTGDDNRQAGSDVY